MWQTVEVPFMHHVRSLRVQFGRCSKSVYKQIGLRRLRTAVIVGKSSHIQAMQMVREADTLLATARAYDEREAARRA